MNVRYGFAGARPRGRPKLSASNSASNSASEQWCRGAPLWPHV
jgi:hypothetical protein